MKKLLTITILICISSILFAQKNENENTFKHHSTFAEVGGNALHYSLNYEYKVLLSPNSKLGFRTGFSAYPIVNNDIDFVLLPGINLLIGNTHGLELGANLGYCIAQTESFIIPSATFGYRFQSKKGLLFRVDLTPYFIPYFDNNPHLNGGFSIGYSF